MMINDNSNPKISEKASRQDVTLSYLLAPFSYLSAIINLAKKIQSYVTCLFMLCFKCANGRRFYFWSQKSQQVHSSFIRCLTWGILHTQMNVLSSFHFYEKRPLQPPPFLPFRKCCVMRYGNNKFCFSRPQVIQHKAVRYHIFPLSPLSRHRLSKYS